jgi:hypothetical protein
MIATNKETKEVIDVVKPTTLADVQKALKVPKGQVNKFGNYKYRSCEDILEAVKPHLNGAYVVITDEIVLIGNRYYVKANATFFGEGQVPITVSAYAREQEIVPGQNTAQITGATSSYARKYALNGLFLIDDTKDPDSTNTHGKAAPTPKIVESHIETDDVPFI